MVRPGRPLSESGRSIYTLANAKSEHIRHGEDQHQAFPKGETGLQLSAVDMSGEWSVAHVPGHNELPDSDCWGLKIKVAFYKTRRMSRKVDSSVGCGCGKHALDLQLLRHRIRRPRLIELVEALSCHSHRLQSRAADDSRNG